MNQMKDFKIATKALHLNRKNEHKISVLKTKERELRSQINWNTHILNRIHKLEAYTGQSDKSKHKFMNKIVKLKAKLGEVVGKTNKLKEMNCDRADDNDKKI